MRLDALGESFEYRLHHLIQAEATLGVQLRREPNLRIDHTIRGQIGRTLCGHPGEPFAGLHDRHGVGERFQILLERP